MTKPVAVLDPQWRRMDELFSPADLGRLHDVCEVVWAKPEPLPRETLDQHLGSMAFYASANPELDAQQIARADNLRAVIELYGAFPDTIDYEACFARGIEVLSTGPGMRGSVAEMAVAMALAGGRGLVEEHELFRSGGEHWLSDNPQTDFSMYGQSIGFIGFGSIGREVSRLLAPFAPVAKVYDPFVDEMAAAALGVTLASMKEVAATSRCLFVTAAPTRTNQGLVTAAVIDAMPRAAMLVLVSRAHVIDFDAMVTAAAEGRIRVATDVFPAEPIPDDHPLRQMRNVVLSPHRGAAIAGGRQLMGKLAVDDIERMVAGAEPQALTRARPDRVHDLAGIQHSKKLESMAEDRE